MEAGVELHVLGGDSRPSSSSARWMARSCRRVGDASSRSETVDPPASPATASRPARTCHRSLTCRVGSRDAVAACAAALDEALGGEPLQRLAHRRQADAEARGEVLQDQSVAMRELAEQDGRSTRRYSVSATVSPGRRRAAAGRSGAGARSSRRARMATGARGGSSRRAPVELAPWPGSSPAKKSPLAKATGFTSSRRAAD